MIKKLHLLKNPAASCGESSTVRNSVNFLIRSLTLQQSAENALAVAVQKRKMGSLLTHGLYKESIIHAITVAMDTDSGSLCF